MKQEKVFLAIGASIALVVALVLVLPSLAASVAPVKVDGNPKCADYGLVGFKPRDESGDIYKNGTYTFTIYGMGSLTMTIANGPNVSWISTFGIDKVIVKGGPNANVYSYSPASMGDTNLTTPTNPNNNKPYGLSHVEFCYTASQAVPADYGDLPSAYGITQLGENGARHIPLASGDVWLGALRDLELSGVPDDNALSDDNIGSDEDGVMRGPTWGEGEGVISVTVTGPSCLMGWVDWATVTETLPYDLFKDFGFDYKFSDVIDKDGTFYTEKVIDNIYLSGPGTYMFTFSLPDGFKNATVYARFRLSPATFLIPAGELNGYVQCDQGPAGLGDLVMGGEVEDYLWRFGPTAVDLKKVSATPQQSTTGIGLFVVGLAVSLTAVWFGRRRRQ